MKYFKHIENKIKLLKTKRALLLLKKEAKDRLYHILNSPNLTIKLKREVNKEYLKINKILKKVEKDII